MNKNLESQGVSIGWVEGEDNHSYTQVYASIGTTQDTKDWT